MEPKKILTYKRSGPEKKLQLDLIALLKARDWDVFPTHGNEYSMGFPDLFCAHYTLGSRWVEVKNPESFKMTPAQMEVFPRFMSKGVGIWILCYADEIEYEKLKYPANWHLFLGKSSMVRPGFSNSTLNNKGQILE